MTEDPKLPALIAGCRKKHEPSQIALYRHFYRYGMGICLRYTKSRESALEMLNDGFLKVFLKIDQYDSRQAFRPWLRQTLVHAAIDHYRKYAQKRIDDVFLAEDYSIEKYTESSYNEALERLEYEDLLIVMQELPTAYRMVFNLYVMEGFTHQEIAQQLGISIGTSKSNLSRARYKLKMKIKDLWFVDYKPQ